MRSFHLAAPATTSLVRERERQGVTVTLLTHDTILIRESGEVSNFTGLWPTRLTTEQWSQLKTLM